MDGERQNGAAEAQRRTTTTELAGAVRKIARSAPESGTLARLRLLQHTAGNAAMAKWLRAEEDGAGP
ncbi:hypothetical protein [Streptomyces sp. NPDC088400]|uniref:hypothetical protein n=1 Tax=Streptomyces sp. NPDC088400 TaxID=3365861 RepID=UPI0038269A5D